MMKREWQKAELAAWTSACYAPIVKNMEVGMNLNKNQLKHLRRSIELADLLMENERALWAQKRELEGDIAIYARRINDAQGLTRNLNDVIPSEVTNDTHRQTTLGQMGQVMDDLRDQLQTVDSRIEIHSQLKAPACLFAERMLAHTGLSRDLRKATATGLGRSV